MRVILSVVGTGSAIAMAAVSAALNYLFLFSLGKTPVEGHALGTASVAADILKTLLPFFIAWSWQAKRFMAVVSGLAMFVFFAGFSFLSAIGFAADNRLVLLDRRDTATVAYASVQHDLDQLKNQLSALPRHRATAVVAEEIEGHRQNLRWIATKECREATEPSSRKYCTVHFALRAELAASNEAMRLRAEISVHQTQADTLRQSGAVQDRDPQTAILSRMFGWEQDTVRLALIIAVALLVEIGASLGLFLASGHRREGAPAEEAPHREPPHAGSVEDFCLEALSASPRSALAKDELLAGYQAWCLREGHTPLDAAFFAAAFSAIADEIGLLRDPVGYRGIALNGAGDDALAA